MRAREKIKYEVNDIMSSKYLRYWQYNFPKHTKCRQVLSTIFLPLSNHKCQIKKITVSALW
jgi:hypothetical protein